MRKVGKIIGLIAAGIVFMLFGYTLISNLFIARPSWGFDYPLFIEGKERLVSIWYVIGAIVYFVALVIFFKILTKHCNLAKVNKLILVIAPIIIFIICALIPVAAYADQANIIRIPTEYWQGIRSAFEHNDYLDLYPNNIGTVLAFLPLYVFTIIDEMVGMVIGTVLVRVIQIICTTLMIYYLGKIFALIFKEKKQYITLLYLLCFTSLPIIFMVNLIYGDVIGTFFFVMGIYYFLNYFNEEGRKKDLILGYALVGVGNAFRGVGLIVLIAMTLYYLYQRGFNRWYYFVGGIVVFIFVNLGFDLIAAAVFSLSLPVGSNGMPITSWIQMGLTGPLGYWTGYGILDIWKSDALSVAEKKAYYWDNIKNIMNSEKLGGILKLFLDKMRYQYGEGTFQIELNGIGVEATKKYNGIGAWYYSTFVTKLLEGENSLLRRSIIDYQYVTNMFILFLAMIGIIRQYKKPHIATTIIGGTMAFYCLWELKSRYIYVILPFMLLLALIGLMTIIETSNRLIKRRKVEESH